MGGCEDMAGSGMSKDMVREWAVAQGLAPEFSCKKEKCASYVKMVAIVGEARAPIVPLTCESNATAFPEANCPFDASVEAKSQQIVRLMEEEKNA